MIQELIHTSAPEGLQRGSRGFCTVRCTKGMPRNLMEFLESHSGYRHCRQPPHPTNFSHVSVRLGGHRYHVLSRIANCGADYTGRTNKLAHHLALTPDELVPDGPAHILQAKHLWKTVWNETPQWVEQTPHLPTDRPLVGPCVCWSQLTGDAGWAGVLADSALNGGRPMSVIFEAGTDTLALVDEAIRLLPPDRFWDVTFSTYFTGLGAGVECQWRFLLDGTREADIARRNTHAPLIDLVDLARSHKRAPDSAAVQAARDGRCIEKQRLAPPPPPRSRPTSPAAVDWTDEEDENSPFAAAVAEAAEAEAKSGRPGAALPPPPPPPSLPTVSPFHKRSTAPKKWNWAVAVPITITVFLFLLFLIVLVRPKKRGSGGEQATSVAQSEPVNAARQEKHIAENKSGKDAVQNKETQEPSPSNKNVDETSTKTDNNAGGSGAESRSNPTTGATAGKTSATPNAKGHAATKANQQTGKTRIESQQKQTPPPPSKPTYQPLPALKRNEPFQDVVNLDKAAPQKVQLTLFSAAVKPSDKRVPEPYELKKTGEPGGEWLVTVKKKVVSVETNLPVGVFKLNGNLLQFQWDGNAPKKPDPNGLRYSLLEVNTGFGTKRFFLCKPLKTASAVEFDFTKRLPFEIPFQCPAFINSNNLKVDLRLNGIPIGWKVSPTSFSGMGLAQAPEIIRINPNRPIDGKVKKVCRTDFEVELTFTYDTKRQKPFLNYTVYCFPGALKTTGGGAWHFEPQRSPWIIPAKGRATGKDSFTVYSTKFAKMCAAIHDRIEKKQQIDNRIRQLEHELNGRPPPNNKRRTQLENERATQDAERKKIENEIQAVKGVAQNLVSTWKNYLELAMRDKFMKQACLEYSIYIEVRGQKLVLVKSGP